MSANISRFYSFLVFFGILLLLATPLHSIAAGSSGSQSKPKPVALKLIINGKNFPAAVPELINKLPYVPLNSSLFAELGISLKHEGGGFYRFSFNGVTGSFGADTRATINNASVTLTHTTSIYNGKRYAPLRLLTNLLGLDVVYRTKTATVEIKTPTAAQSLLYGYVTRQDGRPVKNGRVTVTNLKTNAEVVASIADGFYRVPLTPGVAYEAVGVHDFAGEGFGLENRRPFTPVGGERRYLPISETKHNVIVHLQYPDGLPVKRAVITDTGRYSVTIVGGVGGVAISPDSGPITFTEVAVDGDKNAEWDISYPYQLPAGGTDEITITLLRTNVTIEMKDSRGKPLPGSLTISGRQLSGEEYILDLSAEGGKHRTYLPDGSYTLHSYFNYPTRQHYSISAPFTVTDGKVDRPQTWTMPDPNISGSLAFSDGTDMVNGYVQFYKQNGPDLAAWVNEDGTYSIYVPDGTYRVYLITVKEFGTYYADEEFVVRNGKPESDTDIIVVR